ncbi:MAG: sensor histidine kinase [Blastocatellia bacterium]
MSIIRPMNFRERGTTSTLIVVAALLLLLPLLAVLQYRWLAQLSEREREHLRSNLRATATRFSQDFDDEITRAYVVFSPSPDLGKEEELSAYAARYDRWLAVAQYPRLVKDVLVAHADEKGQLHLHQLKTEIKQFVPCDWPQELSTLRSQLVQSSRSDQRAFGRDLMNRRLQLINDETVVCFHPILIPPTVDQRGQIALPAPVGFVIVTLSMAEIRQEALPALAKRHFIGADGADGFDYSAAIVTETPQPKIIYQVGPEPSAKTEADVTVGLMGLRREEMRRLMGGPQPGGGSMAPALPPAGTSRPPVGAQPPPGFQRGGGPRGFPPPNEEQKLWQLRLTHHAGSLDAAVASLRRRNLLISFGILLLLTASIALVILSARRAHRLARQQMDFVAGVSHELRTPLAVIKSAAWNLTRGVIKDPEQIKRYSTLIGRESDRLIEMIEQALEFAGAQSGRQKFDLQPASVNELIDNVLASAQPLLSEGNFQVEKNIAADLPLVMADAPALARALRNLIDNAMKYSGDNRWIGVRAQTAGGGKSEVRITISDRGLGIPAEELKHVFEPFWRGSEATAAQIHGNGLGLNLVRNIVNAHGGNISVQSAPGKGSSFTLTLPAISQAATQPATVTSYLDARVKPTADS